MVVVLATPFPPDPSVVDSDDESNALVVSLLLPGLAGSTVDGALGLLAAPPLKPESCSEAFGFLLGRPPLSKSSLVDSDDESNALVVSLLLPGLTGSTIDDARVLCAVLCAVSPVLPETCCVASGLV